MRINKTTLLAGIAALALIAGAGAVSAQQTGNEQGNKQPNAASQKMNKGGANQNAGAQNKTGGQMGQNAAGANNSKMGENAGAQNQNRGNMQRNAENHGSMGKNAAQQNRHQHSAQRSQHERAMSGREGMNRQTAQGHERFGRNAAQRNAQAGPRNERNARAGQRNGQNTAAQERNGLQGLQGNARVNTQINDQQRTRIRQTVIDARGAPRVDHVDFNIAVGTVVPRTGVRIMPVPAALVAIDPTWRGLRYFVYEQELVLVDPNTMTIVAVINV
jgi:Protein of unknown function (DUF1236)